MKIRFAILLLFMTFFTALPMEKLAACGDKSDCCAPKIEAEKAVSDSKSCCEHDGPCSQNHPDQPCSPDGCGHCGCQLSVHAGATLAVSVAVFETAVFESGLLKKQAFYFAERQPEEVVLPIWQPPQLV